MIPGRVRYRIMLEDLRDETVRERLRAICTDPRSLDPAARAARVTREIANLLATVAQRIEKRGYKCGDHQRLPDAGAVLDVRQKDRMSGSASSISVASLGNLGNLGRI